MYLELLKYLQKLKSITIPQAIVVVTVIVCMTLVYLTKTVLAKGKGREIHITYSDKPVE